SAATGAGTLSLQIPMEAKLGLRFHYPRKGASKRPGWANVPGRRVRDPLSEDVFDIELDFTWANNSAVQDVNIQFKPSGPGSPRSGIPLNTSGGSPSTVPVDASIPHKWKDVFGIRLGGDLVAVPNLLSLRAGGFWEGKGQDDAYLNLDFDLAQKVGLSGGATVRLGPIDVSVGYQHPFYGTLHNGGHGPGFRPPRPLRCEEPAGRSRLLPQLPAGERRLAHRQPQRVRPRRDRSFLTMAGSRAGPARAGPALPPPIPPGQWRAHVHVERE